MLSVWESIKDWQFLFKIFNFNERKLISSSLPLSGTLNQADLQVHMEVQRNKKSQNNPHTSKLQNQVQSYNNQECKLAGW